jgi:hypothetical protein
MNKTNKFSSTFLSIASVSGIFWMGSYLLRMILTYQIFDETTSVLKPYLNNSNLNGILFTLNPAVITTFVLFITFIVFFVLFLLTAKINLKKNGWLFIIVILVIITAPFEIYLMTIDYKIFTLVYNGSFNTGEIITLLMKRLKDLSSFSLIELFCYCTIVFLTIFQPLKQENS